MTLQDLMNSEVVEHDPTKTYRLTFKHDLTMEQFREVRRLLETQIEPNFGKFLVLGPEVKAVTELTIVDDELQYNAKAEELANALEAEEPLSKEQEYFQNSLFTVATVSGMALLVEAMFLQKISLMKSLVKK